MTACEAAMIMMSGGSNYTDEEKEITENGDYEPESDVRWSKVTVNVPEDKPASIVSLSVTENGTYYASDHSADGFDPVNVNVDDRYDEGYADGYDTGHSEGYDEGYEAGHSDGYSEGYNDGYSDGGQTAKDMYDYLVNQGDENADNIGVMSPFTTMIAGEVNNHSLSVTLKVGNVAAVINGLVSYYVTITLWKGGVIWKSWNTQINALTSQSSKEDGYGVDQLSKCAYLKESGNYIYVYYRYYKLGSWSSYDQWNSALYEVTN